MNTSTCVVIYASTINKHLPLPPPVQRRGRLCVQTTKQLISDQQPDRWMRRVGAAVQLDVAMTYLNSIDIILFKMC